MHIAIAGAGVAGSYLGKMLQKRGHDVDIFEASKKEQHWPVCAWGASRHMLETFSLQAGLDFNNYIYHVGSRLRIELPNNNEEILELKGLVTYNKDRWEKDLLEDVRVNYGVQVTRETFPSHKYSYIIDCTGLHRRLLPRSNQDFLIPAYEFLLENVQGPDEFYVISYKGAKGYFWYFPLDDGRAYVGAGDIDKKYYGIEAFFKEHPEAKIIKKIGRPIRLAPPKRMEPFHHGNIIGVGESIGCVFPMLGEGIIPSLICSDIFLHALDSGKKEFNFEQYRKTVLDRFGYYDDVYKVVRLKMDGKLNSMRHLRLMMSMYRNMKREEKRFGFEISLDKMTRLVNAL
jgi:flavin-dependent dehydrogenase